MKLKKLIAVMISLLMLATSIQPCFADTVANLTQSVPNPLQLQLSMDVLARKSGEGEYVSAIPVIADSSIGFDYKSVLHMDTVRNVINEAVITSVIGGDSDAMAEFNAAPVTTQVQVVIDYPSSAQMADGWQTAGSIDNSTFVESGRSFDGNKVTITYNNIAGLTVSQLRAYKDTYLQDITFDLPSVVSYSEPGTHQVVVTMTGETQIAFASKVQRIQYSGNASQKIIYDTGSSSGGSSKPATKTYIVRFNTNGGTTVEPIELKDQATFKLPVTEKDGYTFEGWYTDAAFKSKFVEGTKVTSNLTLYAKWAEKSDKPSVPSSVEIVIDGVKQEVPVAEVGGKYELDVDKLDVPEKEGFAFNGWYADPSLANEVNGTIEVTGDTQLYPSYINLVAPQDLVSDQHISYIQGYPDGEVKPNADITREEIVAIFYRLLKPSRREEIGTTDSSFPDVENDRWSSKQIATLANGGYIQGDENGLFNPEKPITRAEFVTLVAKFVKNTATPEKNYFSDVTGHWAEDSILKTAYELYWINGYADGTFRPDSYITRAEAITIINRMLVRYGDKSAATAAGWPDVDQSDWFYAAIIEATTDEHEFDRQENGWEEKWSESAVEF